MWRYEFGETIDRLPGGRVAIGTQQFPEVRWLFTGVLAAHNRLTDDEISVIQSKLRTPSKHQDALAELAPLSRIPAEATAEYEVTGFSPGNRTIDWMFSKESSPPILLEVKNRIKDLILHLGEAAESSAHGADEAPEPTTDAEALFRDTLEKFSPSDPVPRGKWSGHFQAIQEDLASGDSK